MTALSCVGSIITFLYVHLKDVVRPYILLISFALALFVRYELSVLFFFVCYFFDKVEQGLLVATYFAYSKLVSLKLPLL